jgi:PAS domain S-box-containing protein
MREFFKRLFGSAQRTAIHDHEERFRLLVESVKEYAIFMLDPQGRITTWNAGAERIKGYTADEIIGQHFSRFYPLEDVKSGKPERALETARSTGKYEDEGWRVRKGGSRFWASVVITALWDQTGTLRGFGKVTRDMTQRKEAEDKARRLLQEEVARQAAETSADKARRAQQDERRQRQQLHVTLASIGDAVIVTDDRGAITFMNPVAQKLTGWQEAHAIGQPLEQVFQIINEETRQPAENPVSRVLRDGTVVGLANHTVLLTRDGREVPIDDSGAPVRNEDGSIGGVVLVFRDVTEVRRFIQTRLHLAAIVESSEDAIISQDLDGIITSWNEGAERMYGYRAAEVMGKPLSLLIPPDHPDEAPALLERIRRDERISHFETVRLRKDGSPVDVSLTMSPIKDSQGKVIGASKIARDITASKRNEAALRSMAVENARLYADLKEADQRKDEFLAMLAHELRNPLAPIRNAVQVIKAPGVNPEIAAEARQMIERQVQHMVRLIDDLLDVSRIMRGKIELRTEPVELARVVAQAVDMSQPVIDAQGQELIVSYPPEPIWLEADPARLAQVMSNLLHNAAKFSQKTGRIWLTAERQGSEAVLRVRDEGAGIESDLLPRIFDLFVQGDRSLERTSGGLGIGLTVARKLVELHRGTVTAQSEGPGRGSEFVVRLPALGKAPLRTSAPAGRPLSPSAARRILVVDDNVDAAESMAMLLRLQGDDVRLAHSGPEALEAAACFRPGIILIDIGLPGMSGLEVARRLRQQPEFQRTTVIAVSGYGRPNDKQLSREAGFDYHLTKPVDPDALLQLLAESEAKA